MLSAAAAIFVGRSRPVVTGGGVVAAVTILQALGWVLVHRWTTVGALAAVAVGLVIAARAAPSSRRAELASAAAIAMLLGVGVVAAAFEARPSVLGLAVVVGAALTLAGSAWWLPRQEGTARAVGTVAGATALVGLWVAAGDDDDAALLGLALGFTALAPAIALAGAAPGLAETTRAWSRWVTVGAAVLGWWAWMGAIGVEHVEAYTVPAATMTLFAGWLQRRASPDASSWAAYGPGLVLGFGPSLALVVAEGGTVRSLVVLVVAAVAVAVGVVERLQAPFVIGGLTLVVEGIDTLAPAVALLPRWLVILAVGLVCVWAGATFEHRLRDLRGGTDALRRLH
jgi:hypothetical protein